MFRSIQWKLVLIYFLLLLFALEVFGVYILSSIEGYFLRDMKTELHNHARLISSLAERYYHGSRDTEGLQQLIRDYSLMVNADLFLLDDNGLVLATSAGLEEERGVRKVQHEVISALLGQPGEAIRVQPDSSQRFYYYAQPVMVQTSPVGVVYMVAGLANIDNTLYHIRRILITGAVLTLVISVVLGLHLSRTITRPLKAITDHARAMQAGDFSQNISVQGDDEIGVLAKTFNTLAGELELSWAEILRQKEKVEGILANLSDGIIVFDHTERVMHINATACIWFGVGRLEMLKSGTSQDFPALQEEGLIRLPGSSMVLRQRRLPLLHGGEKQGTILVLSDITEQQRLDDMREEFVANVSHELRTPLTSIKSYLEALMDHPHEEQAIKDRFMGVINSEADRMVRMVEDLLTLSRTKARPEAMVERVDVARVLEEIVEKYAVQVRNKGVQLELEMGMHMPSLKADSDQLHRLFLNVISNAVKYTPTGGRISVKAFSRNNYLEIQVRDTGIGIPGEALSRVFERFYRADKARSRKDGGTGLGLAIAKQIAESHGGTIFVNSIEGEGTQVNITLPAALKK